jgi:hypothetical protein
MLPLRVGQRQIVFRSALLATDRELDAGTTTLILATSGYGPLEMLCPDERQLCSKCKFRIYRQNIYKDCNNIFKNIRNLCEFGYNDSVKLFTIGYEGTNIEQFFGQLCSAGVETIVDVRQLPLSRKPGFSKRALAEEASSRGLNYVHMVELGCPKLIRDEYKADGDWGRYTEDFNDYLDSQEIVIQKLIEMTTTNKCCLLCFEADENMCHRSLISARIISLTNDTSVTHLRVTRQGLPEGFLVDKRDR